MRTCVDSRGLLPGIYHSRSGEQILSNMPLPWFKRQMFPSRPSGTFLVAWDLLLVQCSSLSEERRNKKRHAWLGLEN